MSLGSAGAPWWVRTRPFWVLYVALILAIWIWYFVPDQYPTIKRVLGGAP